MSKLLISATALGILASSLLAMPAQAARVDVGVNFGVPVYVPAPPVYVRPAPVYAPPPVIYAAPPVVYAPPPPVYVAPGGYYRRWPHHGWHGNPHYYPGPYYRR